MNGSRTAAAGSMIILGGSCFPVPAPLAGAPALRAVFAAAERDQGQDDGSCCPEK
jgi:hypothetical protein